jgi:hypothetical protein
VALRIRDTDIRRSFNGLVGIIQSEFRIVEGFNFAPSVPATATDSHLDWKTDLSLIVVKAYLYSPINYVASHGQPVPKAATKY